VARIVLARKLFERLTPDRCIWPFSIQTAVDQKGAHSQALAA
jgi:hypothetical protein